MAGLGGDGAVGRAQRAPTAMHRLLAAALDQEGQQGQDHDRCHGHAPARHSHQAGAGRCRIAQLRHLLLRHLESTSFS